MDANKPTVYELAENIASDDVKNNFLDFIEYCASLKLKPHLYASEKMNIKYKGKMILRFDPSCLDGNLYIIFTVAYGHQLENLLAEQPEDIQKFFIENIRLCGHDECIGCKPVPKGLVFNILGVKREMCFSEMLFKNPTREQFEYIKKWVIIRREHIKSTK